VSGLLIPIRIVDDHILVRGISPVARKMPDRQQCVLGRDTMTKNIRGAGSFVKLSGDTVNWTSSVSPSGFGLHNPDHRAWR
jgi:hypothetical protein